MKNLEQYKEQIETAITHFEKKTKTELIVAVCPKADPYPAVAFRVSIFCATLIISIFSLFFKIHEPFYLILIYLSLMILFYFLAPYLRIDHFFTSKMEIERETQEKAKEVFLKFHSKGNTDRAILFFLSLWERKIHLLVGSELKAHLTPEELQEVIHEMSPLFKSSQFGHGLLNGIRRLEMVVKDEYVASHDEHMVSRFGDHIHFIE